MDCPVCFTSDREPKRLLCGHTLCIECTQIMVDVAVSDRNGPTVKCPMCTKETILPNGLASSLPTNLLWKAIQDIYKEYPPTTEEMGKCEFCGYNTNIVNMRCCQECCRDMCVECGTTHLKNVLFKDHTIENTMKICCKQHRYTCEYFCVKCDKFLCIMCVHKETSNCSNHPTSIAKLKTIGDESKKDILEFQVNMNEKIKNLDKHDKNHLENLKKKLKLAQRIKSEVCRHVMKLMEMLKAREKQMVEIIKEWEKPIVDAVKQVNSHETDKHLIEELQKSSEEGLLGGIEHAVITKSVLKSLLPAIREISLDNTLAMDINFVPEDTMCVGHLNCTQIDLKNPPHYNRQPFALRDTQIVGQVLPTTINFTRKPVQRWHKTGLNFGNDVMMTTGGHIVVCDLENKDVLMYNTTGEIITTNKQKAVNYLGSPACVAPVLSGSAIIVTDYEGNLTFLKEEDLTMLKRIKVGVHAACGVGVLSDGTLILATTNPDGIGLYNKQYSRGAHITTYGYKQQHNISLPCYIKVLPDDTIVASMYDVNCVVYFTADLQVIQSVPIQNPAGLTITPQADILVVSQYPDCIYHLKGKAGSIQAKRVMMFSDIGEGKVNSVAMHNNHLAVVSYHSLHFYGW